MYVNKQTFSAKINHISTYDTYVTIQEFLQRKNTKLCLTSLSNTVATETFRGQSCKSFIIKWYLDFYATKTMLKSEMCKYRAFSRLLKASEKGNQKCYSKNYCQKRDNCYRLSKLLQPRTIVPHSSATHENDNDIKLINSNSGDKHSDLSINSKLLIENGLVKSAGPGHFIFLPLGLRVLEKLTKVVDECMDNIGGQKILLPTLTPGNLWKKSGRYEKVKDEVLQTYDRHGRLLLLR